MVNLHPSDTIPISNFEFAWRITDARWSSLPDKVLKRIKPLSPSKSKEILENSPFSRLSDRLFDPGRYRASQQVSLEEGSDSGVEQVKNWFRKLPIVSDQEVYLSWQVGDGVAAVTDWGTFIEVWDDLWYPFDRLCVFDETRQWAVFLGPEEQAVFVVLSDTALAQSPRGPFNPPPILCPRCGAVLHQWTTGVRQQVCAHCGEQIAM